MRSPGLPIKSFQPLRWYDLIGPQHYISHILTDLGRLDLDIFDIERHDRPPHTMAVLSDLLKWMENHGNEHHLYMWENFNFASLIERMKKRRNVLPRIQISAYITKMNNLSVRWHPEGWGQTVYLDYDDPRAGFGQSRVVPMNRRDTKENEPSDFLFFGGDEDPTWDSRPSNELMYIRGVGNLDLNREYGPYVRINRNVLDGLLICAVRAAYESLIERLKNNFEIRVVTVFTFVETGERGLDSNGRVIGWSLEDPVLLQQKKDRETFAAIETNYGFTVEKFDEELLIASQPKRGSDQNLMEYQINEKLSKQLKKAGHQITPRVVENLRALITRTRLIPE